MLLLNNVPVTYFKFPAGEIQVTGIDALKSEVNILQWIPTCADDILLLQLTCNALNQCVETVNILQCLYLPYSRQDRVCNKGEALSLEVICKILDDLDFASIIFWDLHNEVKTFKYFKKTTVVNIERFHIMLGLNLQELFSHEDLRLCAPDFGASFDTYRLSDHYDLLTPIRFMKKRDTKTGEIIEYELSCDGMDLDTQYLVVDDICDGGRTFIECAKRLREHTEKNLYLYVTHGIFSNGLEELLRYYKHIYCHHVLDNAKYKSFDRLTIMREFNHGI